jgi:Ca2+-binding RTX toxin-like protein
LVEGPKHDMEFLRFRTLRDIAGAPRTLRETLREIAGIGAVRGDGTLPRRRALRPRLDRQHRRRDGCWRDPHRHHRPRPHAGPGGNDALNALEGDDVVCGGEGADQINGALGNDRLDGEAGNDTINAGAGNDQILGEAGNDIMAGGMGADQFLGGSGIDSAIDFRRFDFDRAVGVELFGP